MGRILHLALALLCILPAVSAESDVEFTVTDAIVYPQDTGLILQKAQLTEGSSHSTLLPPQARRDSIRIVEDSGKVVWVEVEDYVVEGQDERVGSTLPLYQLLEPKVGSAVTLETGYGEYTGSLVWLDLASGILLLGNVNYTLVSGQLRMFKQAPYLTLKAADIRSIILDGKAEKPTSSKALSHTPIKQSELQVSWKDTGNATRQAVLSYLTGGLSWKPVFYLDLPADETVTKARFTFWAQASNSMDLNLSDVDLRLVAGNIKLEQPQVHTSREWMTYSQTALADVYEAGVGGAGAPSVVQVQEYEVYDFPSPVSVNKGETVYMPVFDDYVSYSMEYVWDARSQVSWYGYTSYDTGEREGKVQRIYKLENEGETWPYGTVSVYRESLLLGQDTISWTPKGRQAKVTIGYAPDIEVKRRQTVKAFYKKPESRYDQDYKHTVTLTLKNYKAKPVVVLVMDTYPQNAHDFTAALAFEEKPGNLMHWNLTLQPGQEREVVYRYVTE